MINSTTSIMNLNPWNPNAQIIHQCINTATLDEFSSFFLLMSVNSIICKMKITNAIVEVIMALHWKIGHHSLCFQDKNWKYDKRNNGTIRISKNNSLSLIFLISS